MERAIQTFKNCMIKSLEEGKDLHTVLLDYRITPSNGLKSPAELLMGRRLRSHIPSHPENLTPNFDIRQEASQLRKNQLTQKRYADQGRKVLPELKVHQEVWFRLKPKEPWLRAKIMKVGPQPRTYLVQARNGGTYVRNRFFLRPFKGDDAGTSTTVEDFYESALTTADAPAISPPSPSSPKLPTTRHGRVIKRPSRFQT